MKEIREHNIQLYEFPECDDEEENRLNRKLKVSFSVEPYFGFWFKHSKLFYCGVFGQPKVQPLKNYEKIRKLRRNSNSTL